MIGSAELLIVLVLSGSLYLCLSPPAWYTSSQKLTFIRRYGGLVKQQQLKDLVGGIGLNLARAANYQEEPLEFFVLKSQVPNAFAWDSKTVFVTIGLLELVESKDELAAVLAHEIGHLAAGHPEARAMNRAQSILLSSSFSGMGWVMNKVGSLVSRAGEAAFSRAQEREADRLSITYLLRGGYDPHAAARVLEKLRRLRVASGAPESSLQDLLSTHPVDSERIATVENIARKVCLKFPTRPMQ